MADYEAKLDALMKEMLPAFEELGDTCETITRAVRAIGLLAGARVDPDILLPHFQTAMSAFATLAAMHPRLEAIAQKHRP